MARKSSEEFKSQPTTILFCDYDTDNPSGSVRSIAIAMSILKSDIAVQVSINIMKVFVEMRKIMANHSILFEQINRLELKQIEYKKEIDTKLDKVFDYISENTESSQKIFFDGQIYDAFSLLIGLIQKAEMEIVLVDGYVDVGTLNILSKKKENVAVTGYKQQPKKLSLSLIKNSEPTRLLSN